MSRQMPRGQLCIVNIYHVST